jgi:hypothetical protein
MSDYIFVCTAISTRRLFSGEVGSKTTEAFFFSQPKAVEHILGNYGFFHGCDNDYGVVEEFAEGAYCALDEWWFKWDSKKQAYEHCNKPAFSEGIINWGS